MPAWEVPPILARLAARPTVAGLAVPWTTLTLPDGRYRFGAIDPHRHHHAIHHRLCQTCGEQLDAARIVFAVREVDLRRLLSPEPGMHSECAHYTARACPMLAGRLDHYRATATTQVAGQPVTALGDPGHHRPGAPAPRWHLLWASTYRPVTDPATGLAAALVTPEATLRVRPITTPAGAA